MKGNVIYLAGFMGAGKSTIGPILANTLGWNFYDLDREIEKIEGKKVREIFETKGEDYFRKVEREVLLKTSAEEKVIISLGGGTMANEENLDFLKKTGRTFYLKASKEAVYRRLKYKRDRPALHSNGGFPETKEELMELINKLLNEREKFYLLSDHIILTDNVPVGKTVDVIARIISSN
ncbi:MAG TPA: shikimate kinase [Ignavibacteriaceae bacterium]|nr:shikimate kinase [Ignavibacteriaceae bacterium]